jgi:hypothetical protein
LNHVTQDLDKLENLVNTVMNLRFLKILGKC